MRTFQTVALVLLVMAVAVPLPAQDDEGYQSFSDDQLDNLLAPVALYPDPLLAQVLVAATFPDQIDQASRFVRFDANPDDLDAQPWDVSVKAVAHYPEVLGMMADKLDWTTALGQAYVNQSTDVMAAVQRLRAQAQSAGNLVTSPEMQVVDSGGWIELWPAQPQYLWVPAYDPALVFAFRAPLFFHARFFIGPWLNLDCDWQAHRVYYHGWDHGAAWMERSRPYVRVNPVYVDNRYRDVVVNRTVVREGVNYRALDRYDDVHRTTNFNNLHSRGHGTYNPPPAAQPPPPPPPPATIHNKVIARNIDTADPRLNEFRGHVAASSPPVRVPETPAFTPSRGAFDAREASRRGQVSRSQAQPPPPPPHPAPHTVERKRP